MHGLILLPAIMPLIPFDDISIYVTHKHTQISNTKNSEDGIAVGGVDAVDTNIKVNAKDVEMVSKALEENTAL